MDENERYKIISNDYAELLIEYNGNMNVLKSNPAYSYNIINDKYAILYIPENEMTENSISKFGYSSIPKCYGLMAFQAETERGITLHEVPERYLTGKNVLVGIVDTGIVYTLPIFQYPDKTSKIVSIWDQTLDSSNHFPEGFYYGTEYNREQINTALNSDNPHGIVPSTDEVGEGNAMAGIAAAFFDKAKRFAGDAIDAELVIVKLKPTKPYLRNFFGIPEDVLSFQENDIIMGVKYLLEVAQRLHRPISICIGIGSCQGSHKGTEIISQYLSSISNISGTAITISAGNEGSQNHHYYGEIVPPGYQDSVELIVSPNDKNFNMELWGFPSDLLKIDIYAPSGESVYKLDINFTEQSTFEVKYADTIIYIDYIISETYSKEQLILFRFKNIKDGLWKFNISGTSNLVTRFHIWLPIHDFISENTYFNHANPYTTICQPGNAPNIITASSYYPPARSLDPSAGKGFTSIYMPKPDIAAPGVNIMAHSLTGILIPFSGTSIAAAHTAGIAAQYLEWGIINGNLPSMNSINLRYLLTNSAERATTEVYPNADWGFGLIE